MGLALASAVIPGLFTTPVNKGAQSSRMAKLAKLNKETNKQGGANTVKFPDDLEACLLYTSDAADE